MEKKILAIGEILWDIYPDQDEVISTVGAGDSFTAAWLTGYLQGDPIELCLKKAAELSGFVVAHTEAVPRY